MDDIVWSNPNNNTLTKDETQSLKTYQEVKVYRDAKMVSHEKETYQSQAEN